MRISPRLLTWVRTYARIVASSTRSLAANSSRELERVVALVLVEHRHQQIDLAREVVQDALAGDADLGRDRIDRHAAKAARGERPDGRLHDPVARRPPLGGRERRPGHGEEASRARRTPDVVSSPWHQDLCEGPAPEALLFDDLQLEVLSRSANGLRPAPIAIGTVVSWYSSTRPSRVSDLAKPGPPWTRIVPSSSRAFRSAIAAPRSPPKISTGPQSAFSRVRENTAFGFSFIAVAIGPSDAAQCGPMIS